MSDNERIFELESRIAAIWNLIAPNVDDKVLEVPCAIIRLSGFDPDSEIYDDELDPIIEAAEAHIKRGWR